MIFPKMKKTALAIALLSAALPALAQEPAITFDETSYDFGTIAEDGGNVSHEFKFTNTGDAPLVIVTVSASCGCTKPEFDPKPIAPGDSSEIKIRLMETAMRASFISRPQP